MLGWAFTQTNIFENWTDFFQFIYFVGGLAIGWILGVRSHVKLKELLQDAERIIFKADVPINTKYQKLVDIVHKVFYLLGLVFEQYNEQRREKQKKKDLEQQEKVKQD